MTQRPGRSDSIEQPISRGLRSFASSSDVLSQSAKSLKNNLPHANPPPAYVAESAAENLLYAEIEFPIKISPGALALVNAFLDEVLFDILLKSHSTTLAALRAAVPVALKQRLGKAAVQAADEELQDYLDEEELAELQTSAGSLDPKSDFDVDLAWTLTRLRCMVYAKLGDLEEEDEEDFLDDEELRFHVARVKEEMRASATITPASAIFLTTILEFLGEQALCIAAQHARRRYNAARSHPPTQSDIESITLEEIDMSGVGKEGPLIRLWRSWKGSARGSISSRPTTPSIMSPMGSDSPTFEWRSPTATGFSTIQEERSPSTQPSATPVEASIPLPMSDNDIEEIEVPGLARDFEDEDNEENQSQPTRPELSTRRPSSMLLMPGNFPTLSTYTEGEQSGERPHLNRVRSHSLPNPARAPTKIEPEKQEPEKNETEKPEDVQTIPQLQSDLETPSNATPLLRNEAEPSEAPVHQQVTAYSSRADAMDATVATIAGALSVEASRGFRREQPSHHRLASESTMQRSEEINETDGPHELGTEPEAEHNDRINHRDSGFGVDVPDHVDQQQVPHTSATISNAAQTNGLFVEAGRNPMEDSPTVRTPYEEHDFAIHDQYPSDTITDSNTTAQHGEGTDHSKTSSVVLNSTAHNTSGPSITSAWPAVVPNRRSSLEQQAGKHSPTETRFPQHLPSNQRFVDTERTVADDPGNSPRSISTAFATPTSHHSRNTSIKNGRPGTAGSSTARKQHIRLRSEEDGANRVTPPEELDRAKKSLDVLIDSDETLHYTLTPESARASHEASKIKAVSQTQELADFFRNTAPPGAENSRPKSSAGRDLANGLRSSPLASHKVSAPVVPSQSKIQQTSNSPSKPRNPLGEPRDARMTSGTVRDLADYARSTGPENEMQLPKALQGRPLKIPTVFDRPQTEKSSIDTQPNRPSTNSSNKTANRIKYQARDARAPRTAESSDLIDFIREGPPRTAGEHRIDRKVAPFRTTMDSDDLNALAPPPDIDGNPRHSDASAQESAVTIKSMQSSMNSRTGLLDSTNRGANRFTNGTGSTGLSLSKQPVIEESEGMPKRTRRRVRDPYAIDLSDDEEVNEEPSYSKGRTDEESLVDFLRNTAPPPGMTTQPILAANPNSNHGDGANTITRSASSSKLRDYLQNATGGRNGGSPNKPGNSARAESPHLTQVGSKMDKYRPTQPTHAPHVERNRQKARVEPREPSAALSTGTADLAAYLKNTGPAPGTEIPVQRFVTSTSKDQAGFMKFFSRRASIRK